MSTHCREIQNKESFCIQNPVKHLRWSVFAANYFCKTLHIWCFAGFWIRLWSHLCTSCSKVWKCYLRNRMFASFTSYWCFLGKKYKRKIFKQSKKSGNNQPLNKMDILNNNNRNVNKVITLMSHCMNAR